MLPFSRTIQVADASGQIWHIQRRWFPRWRLPGFAKRFRIRRKNRKMASLSDFSGADGVQLEGLLVMAGLLIFAALVWMIIIPVLLLVLDLLVAILLVVLTTLGRISFRRPWVIEAKNSSGVIIQREAIGWKASKLEIKKLGKEIKSGLITGPEPARRMFWDIPKKD